jgi:Caspase recruitment domain
MDSLWKTVVQMHRCDIIRAADADDIVLNRVIDHLLSHNLVGLLSESVQEIRKLTNSHARMRKLLDVLLDRGPDASIFHVFCDALKHAECDFIVEQLRQSYDNLRNQGTK